MMNEQHVTTQISDYVLGLLAAQARRDVERHMAHCEMCRAALQQERALVQLVRETLDEAIRPNPVRLQQFTPPTLTSRRTRRQLRHAVAVVTLLLVVFLGNLGLLQSGTAVVYAEPAPALAQPIAGTPTASGTPAVTAQAQPVFAWPELVEGQAPPPIPTPATPHLK
ncbi:MAG: zf-HC2 domain-containing protein [Anaerolineae bacterium]|nr:zf-HC2 domain-containing protein [Anaerolineales bacterium]MCO5190112.1 zf-HC2 domain-containing protein [Anaerolineae bacterium]MCO5192688.1 zf-HC2 domain-containing protein [Anaerolineae bacterium]